MPMVALASGVTLSYEERGSASAPALVFVPGPTDSWRSYEPVLRHLPSDVRAVAVSARGHGESDKPKTGYTVHDFAADLVRLLDALEIDRAVLTGHSGSTLVARRVALDHPDRVAGLILEASPLTLRGHPALRNFVDAVVPTLSDPIDADFARSFVLDLSSDRLDASLADTLVEEVRLVPARVWTEMFSSLLEYDDVGELSRLEVPALLVWGDADPLIDYDAQVSLTRAIPHAELLVYAGAGHTPRWEEPARFATDVTTVVRRAHGESPGR